MKRKKIVTGTFLLIRNYIHILESNLHCHSAFTLYSSYIHSISRVKNENYDESTQYKSKLKDEFCRISENAYPLAVQDLKLKAIYCKFYEIYKNKGA